MTSLTAFTVLVLLVGVERLAELVVSKRNAAWSFERGGVETGFSHYPPMVLLHTGLLGGALVEAYVREPHVPSALAWSMLIVVVLSQALRWWCITTLGRQWNTRVIVVPGMAPVPERSVPDHSAPELCRGRRRGHRAAVGARVLDHRRRLHGAQRRHPHGAAPGRERRPRNARGDLQCVTW